MRIIKAEKAFFLAPINLLVMNSERFNVMACGVKIQIKCDFPLNMSFGLNEVNCFQTALMIRILYINLILAFAVISSMAQRMPDEVYMPQIKTIKFNKYGDPTGYPIMVLSSADQLTLDFDDMEGGVKSYYYTMQLCNADWTPAQMSYFDYVKGYSQVRISTYRMSSISLTRYTHYQTVIPDRNCQPTKSGNYLLKVFLNGDTSKLAFTKRFLVVEPKLDMAIQVTQPFSQMYFQTHHRLQVQLSTRDFDVRYPQQQVKLFVLQNYRWDNNLVLTSPTFIRQDMLQYSNETEMVMPAGKEFRWLNVRSFRLLGDRITKQTNNDSSFNLFVKEDQPRISKQYYFYRDMNGMFINETIENINPYWNADYANIHFTYRPAGGIPFKSDLVIFGELTNYGKDPNAVMKFDAQKGVYEADLQLKQGYYDYAYTLKEKSMGSWKFNETPTEQDAWETENAYLVLVYFRPLGGRYDELVAIRQVGSQFNRNLR